MITTILIILFVVCAVASSLFFVFVHLGWRRALHTPPGRGTEMSVTIVVAAHNASATLPDLLAAMRTQSCPQHRMQIVIVDDRSSDGTAEVIVEHGNGLDIDVIRIDETPGGVSPKKYALHRGIQKARHDVILLTDADCVPQTEWVTSMLRIIAQENDVVLGLAPLESRGGGASRYAAFESRRTMALMAAAAGWNRAYMASGRSWGFTKEIYARAGGLEPLYAHLGGDDDLLLQRFVRGGARVGVCMEAGSRVHSSAPGSWNALYRQKLRHYRVSSAYRGRTAVLLGMFVLTEILTPILGIVLTIVLDGPVRILPPLFICWKLWYDTGFLVGAFRWMKGETARVRLAMLEGFHMFYAGIVGLISFVKPPRW